MFTVLRLQKFSLLKMNLTSDCEWLKHCFSRDVARAGGPQRNTPTFDLQVTQKAKARVCVSHLVPQHGDVHYDRRNVTVLSPVIYLRFG